MFFLQLVLGERVCLEKGGELEACWKFSPWKVFSKFWSLLWMAWVKIEGDSDLVEYLDGEYDNWAERSELKFEDTDEPNIPNTSSLSEAFVFKYFEFTRLFVDILGVGVMMFMLKFEYVLGNLLWDALSVFLDNGLFSSFLFRLLSLSADFIRLLKLLNETARVLEPNKFRPFCIEGK